MDTIEANKKHYEEVYKAGYGLLYPDGHVIRWYEKVLKGILSERKSQERAKLLDFGCGIGAHASYFSHKGLDVYGVDVVAEAIDKVKSIGNLSPANFFTIKPMEDLTALFPHKFDVIFSNQVLYYFNNNQRQDQLLNFDALLKPGGVVMFTMMSAKNNWYRHVKETYPDGMSLLELESGVASGTSYINFVMDEADMVSKFSVFEPLFIGYYDMAITGDDAGHHYIFTGKKRNK